MPKGRNPVSHGADCIGILLFFVCMRQKTTTPFGARGTITRSAREIKSTGLPNQNGPCSQRNNDAIKALDLARGEHPMMTAAMPRLDHARCRSAGLRLSKRGCADRHQRTANATEKATCIQAPCPCTRSATYLTAVLCVSSKLRHVVLCDGQDTKPRQNFLQVEGYSITQSRHLPRNER